MHMVSAHFQAACTKGELTGNCVGKAERSINVFLTVCLDAPGGVLFLEGIPEPSWEDWRGSSQGGAHH